MSEETLIQRIKKAAAWCRTQFQTVIWPRLQQFASKAKQYAHIKYAAIKAFFARIAERCRPGFLLLTHGIKRTVNLIKKPLLFIRNQINQVWLIAKKNSADALQKGWGKISQLSIKGKSIGEHVDAFTARIMQYEWVQNLIEATQYDTQKPTLVTTCFSNILALVFPLALMQVYDRVIPNRTMNTLVFLTIGVVAVFAVDAFLRIVRAYINLWADTKYEFSLAKTAFSKIMNAPMYISEKSDVGTRLKQFSILDQLKGFYNTQLLTSLYEIPFLLLFIIAIAYLAGFLFLVPLLTAVATGYVTWRFSEKWKTLLERKITFDAKESDFIINVLTGIHTAKSIGMEELLIRRHERLQETGTEINYESSVHDNDLLTIKAISSQTMIALTTTFGAIWVIEGNLAIGGLAACILLAGRVMQPFDRILSTFNRLSMINMVRRKLDTIFELPSDNATPEDEAPIIAGEIALHNLSFSYTDNKENNVLENITVTFPCEKLVGIIGKNSPEKTALVNILSTIIKPTGGEYCIDGKNIEAYNASLLHKKIAYLNRAGKLFRGTIMDNLSAFDEQLIPAARRLVDRLGLNAILSKLPNGYDTYVGEKAVEALPGGVLNLIFIIRALANKPKIVIFDEANINLDTNYTQNMMNLLLYLKEQTTVIVFVNKASTLEMMDCVFELKDKSLHRVEHGS